MSLVDSSTSLSPFPTSGSQESALSPFLTASDGNSFGPNHQSPGGVQLPEPVIEADAAILADSLSVPLLPEGLPAFSYNQAVDSLLLERQVTGEQTLSSNTSTDLTGTDFIEAGTTRTLPDPIRINAGGGAYTDSLGQVWLADQYFSDGPTADINSNTATITNEIEGTDNDRIYQSERYAKNLNYYIPVENGTYDVNLHFAEIFWSGENKRLFNIEIEGQTLSNQLDIFAEVGKHQALQRSAQSIVVTDGRLDIQFTTQTDHAKLSGLEVFAQAVEENVVEADDADNKPPLGPNPLTDNATVRYISPNGTGDGSSWEKAARLSQLDALIEQSGTGDEIWLAGDLGVYDVAGQTIIVDSGGKKRAPIRIRGAASKVGGEDTPVFVGDRASNWRPGAANGGEVFRLLSGADYLHFSNFDFRNVGNGAFRLGGELSGITIEDMSAENVRRFVENAASGGAKTASVTDLTIRDVEVKGFSRGAIRLQYNTNKVLIEDVLGDSQGQDGDNFAMGVHLDGSVHNVVHRRVTMNNAIQTKNENSYWNADGFVTEKGTYNITYIDTYAAGSTDGGYDLKSQKTKLIRAGAADNKRNFRIWGTATMIDVTSDDPIRRGGTGTDAHIHVLDTGKLVIKSGTFTGDRNINNIIFDVDDTARLVVQKALITDDLYRLKTVEEDGRITLRNIVES